MGRLCGGCCLRWPPCSRKGSEAQGSTRRNLIFPYLPIHSKCEKHELCWIFFKSTCVHAAAAGSPEADRCPSQYSFPGNEFPSHAYMATTSMSSSSSLAKGSRRENRILMSVPGNSLPSQGSLEPSKGTLATQLGYSKMMIAGLSPDGYYLYLKSMTLILSSAFAFLWMTSWYARM